jgi:UDP:flavonoid glycosyltransferase YjiC (YdhE family)
LVASVFADQPYWAWRVANAGVGIASRYRDLSARVLDTALDRLMMGDMQLAAKQMAMKLRAESGAENAADVIERWCGVRHSQAA